MGKQFHVYANSRGEHTRMILQYGVLLIDFNHDELNDDKKAVLKRLFDCPDNIDRMGVVQILEEKYSCFVYSEEHSKQIADEIFVEFIELGYSGHTGIDWGEVG